MSRTARRLLTLAAAAGGVAALRRRSAGHRSGAGRALRTTSRAARNVEIAALSARVGTATTLTRARQVFASAERRNALDRELQLRTADDVARTLGEMKGALMKLGQMASYLDTGLPEPLRLALAQLQADAPPMSVELAERTLTEELGRPPQELFAEWDPDPIAAASIGQVQDRKSTRLNSSHT